MIVRLAAKAGIPVPTNARVMSLIKGVEAGTVKRPLRSKDVLSAAEPVDDYSAA